MKRIFPGNFWTLWSISTIPGALQEIIGIVCKKLAKGKSVAQIADELEQELEYISRICGVAEKYAPAYNPNAIFRKLTGDSMPAW